MSAHVHVWKPVAHVDGCHYFMWRYVCECGYGRETSQERDLAYDGWSSVWMTNDDGSPMCERCEELLDGAALLPPVEITKPASLAPLTSGPGEDRG